MATNYEKVPSYFEIKHRLKPQDPQDIIFSGPDDLADHRTHMPVDPRPKGSRLYTPYASYASNYLWRLNPPNVTPVQWRRKHKFPGEIGWGAAIDWSAVPHWLGHQILSSEFRRFGEDFNTHRFQDAWYPQHNTVKRYTSYCGTGHPYFSRYLHKPDVPGAFRKDDIQGRSLQYLNKRDKNKTTNRCLSGLETAEVVGSEPTKSPTSSLTSVAKSWSTNTQHHSN